MVVGVPAGGEGGRAGWLNTGSAGWLVGLKGGAWERSSLIVIVGGGVVNMGAGEGSGLDRGEWKAGVEAAGAPAPGGEI